MIKKQATNLAAIRKGDGIIAKVYKGDTLRYNSAHSITYNLDGIVTPSQTKVKHNAPFTLSFTTESGKVLLPSTVRVTMGGVDVTDTAFDFGTMEVTLASVTGDVTIEAIGAAVDAEVEWIQSNNSAYIDTGIVPTSRNFVIELNFQWIGNVATDFETFIGFMAESSKPRSGFHKYGQRWMFGTNVTSATSIVVDNDKHTIKIIGNASDDQETLYIDGNVINTTTTTSEGIADNSLSYYISARHRPNTIDNPALMRIFSAKIEYPINTITRDFIPVRKNGVAYLYDKVSGQLFGNAASTGTFTFGSDVTSNGTNSLNLNNGLLGSLNGNEPNDEPNEIDPIAMEDM